jgi:hypothetical protein
VAWPCCAHSFSLPDLMLSLFCRWLSLYAQPWAILAPAELSHVAPGLQRKELASEFGSCTSCRCSVIFPVANFIFCGSQPAARSPHSSAPWRSSSRQDFCRCFPLCASWVKARVFPVSPKGRPLLHICYSGLHQLLLHLSLA